MSPQTQRVRLGRIASHNAFSDGQARVKRDLKARSYMLDRGNCIKYKILLKKLMLCVMNGRLIADHFTL